jgi:hypothetical protein
MSRETFVNKNFQATTLGVVEQANAIITEYEEQGLSCISATTTPTVST